MGIETYDIANMINCAIAARRADYARHMHDSESCPIGSGGYETKVQLAKMAMRDAVQFEAIAKAYADGTLVIGMRREMVDI